MVYLEKPAEGREKLNEINKLEKLWFKCSAEQSVANTKQLVYQAQPLDCAISVARFTSQISSEAWGVCVQHAAPSECLI